eukprot:g3978.t1
MGGAVSRRRKPAKIEDVASRAKDHHKTVAAGSSFEFSQMQVANLRTAFDGMKQKRGRSKDATQNLSPVDFAKMFSFEPGQCNALFRIFDVDNDGTIDLNEFISGFCFMCKGSVEEKAALMFTANDLDGNGTLDRQEVAAMLRDINSRLTVLQTAVDQIGVHSNAAAEWDPTETEEMVTNMFAQYDDNGDGVISKEEFCGFMKSDASAIKYSKQLEQLAVQVLYSGINNPQSQRFWSDVQTTGGPWLHDVVAPVR